MRFTWIEEEWGMDYIPQSRDLILKVVSTMNLLYLCDLSCADAPVPPQKIIIDACDCERAPCCCPFLSSQKQSAANKV